MPVNYNALNQNAPQQLGAMFDPVVQAEKQSRLSDLAMNRDAKRMQMQQMQQQMQAAPVQAQRSEQLFQQGQEDRSTKMQATQAQQKEKYGKQLDFSIANDLKSGLPVPLVAQRATAKGNGFGFNADEIAQGLDSLTSITDPQARIAHYRDSASGKFEKPKAENVIGQERLRIAQDTLALNRQESAAKAAAGTAQAAKDAADPAFQLTKGQEAADRVFGKLYAEYKAGGAFADTMKQINQLETVAGELDQPGNDYTGPAVGNVPDAIRSFSNPAAVNAQNLVEEVVQRNLRLVLGAQFTQSEGERLIARAYNPRLLPAQNAKRVRALLNQMTLAAKAKESAAQYFEEHGTLNKWKGNLVLLSDVDEAITNADKSSGDAASDDSGWSDL